MYLNSSSKFLVIFLICCHITSLKGEEPLNYLEDITISLSQDSSDYFKTSFDDQNIYYFKQEISDRPDQGICQLNQPSIIYEPIQLSSRDCTYTFFYDIHFGCIKYNTLKMMTITQFEQTGLNFDLNAKITIQGIPDSFQSTNQNTQYDKMGKTLFILDDNQIRIYLLNGLTLKFVAYPELDQKPDLENMKLTYLKPDMFFIFSKKENSLAQYSIKEKDILHLEKKYEDVKDFQSDEYSAYIIYGTDKLLILNDGQEYKEPLPYGFITSTNPINNHLMYYQEDTGSSIIKGSIYEAHIELEDIQIQRVLDVPRGVKSMILTNNSLLLYYEQYLRVYHRLSDFNFQELENNIYFLSLDEQQQGIVNINEFITYMEKDLINPQINSQKIQFLQLSVDVASIECKKQKQNLLSNQKFQARILTSSCDYADAVIQKFENGSCGFIQDVYLVPKAENELLSYFLGFGIGVFFTVLFIKITPKCKGASLFLKEKDEQSEYISRQKRLKMNRGLSSSYVGSRSQDTKKFIYGGNNNDHTIPSEEFRDLSPTMNKKQNNPPKSFLGHNFNQQQEEEDEGNDFGMGNNNKVQIEAQKQSQYPPNTQVPPNSSTSGTAQSITFETPRFNLGLGLGQGHGITANSQNNSARKNVGPASIENSLQSSKDGEGGMKGAIELDLNTNNADDDAIEEMPSAEDRTTKRNEDSFGEM